MKKKPIKSPLSPRLPDLLPTKNLESFISEEVYSNCLIEHLDHPTGEIHFITFEQTKLKKCRLTNLTMPRFEASDTIFDHCDFSNTEMIGATFHRVLFKNCKLIGANFAESIFVDCEFDACLADFSTFSYTNFKTARLNQTSFIESDFFEMKWQHLTISNCDFTASNWFHTPLAGLNFANSTIERIVFSPNQIKGLTIHPQQAVLIAQMLGLIIEE